MGVKVINGINPELLYKSKRTGEIYKVSTFVKQCAPTEGCSHEVLHYKLKDKSIIYSIPDKVFAEQFEALLPLTSDGKLHPYTLRCYLESLDSISYEQCNTIIAAYHRNPSNLGIKVRHLKTGNLYIIYIIVLNCTNGMENEYSVTYQNAQGAFFSRNTLKEFFEKFEVL